MTDTPTKRIVKKAAAPAAPAAPVKKAVKKMAAAPVSRPSTRDNGDDDAPARPVKKAVAKQAAPAKKAVAKKAAAPATRRPVDDGGEETDLRGGWSAAQETMDSTTTWAATFKPSTNTQIIKILEVAPYASFRRHWINRVGVGQRAYACLESVGRDCPLCDVGDRPSAVSAFNIALIGDDGEAVVKAWECGARITQTLKTFSGDPKIGPLNKRTLYFAVSKTEATQKQQVQTLIHPVRERDLQDDFDVPPITDEQLERLLTKVYTREIVELPRAADLEEIAAEMLNEDSPGPKGWGE